MREQAKSMQFLMDNFFITSVLYIF